MTHFIYRPKSGDRVFASSSGRGQIEVIRWGNGSRHIFGACVLSYIAAVPGAYWRDPARTAARAIVDAHSWADNALAWDEQGTICLAMPPASAFAADEMMRAARRTARIVESRDTISEDMDNRARMVQCGAALLMLEYQRDDGTPLSIHGLQCRPCAAKPLWQRSVRGSETAQLKRLVRRIGPEKQEIEFEASFPDGLPSVWLTVCRAPIAWGRPVEATFPMDDEASVESIEHALASVEDVLVTEKHVQAAGLCLEGSLEWLRGHGIEGPFPVRVPVAILRTDDRAMAVAMIALKEAPRDFPPASVTARHPRV